MGRVAMLVLLAAVGCDGSLADPRLDATMPDASGMDAALDASGLDASGLDASGLDASGLDAGGRDSGAGDSGVFGPCAVGGVAGTCRDVATCVGVSTPGLCPGPSHIQCCTPRVDGGATDGGAIDGGAVCDPADMPTPNAGLVEGPGSPTCPSGMQRVAAFCVDRYEAALVLVDDGGPIGSWSPFHNPGSARVAAVSASGAIPQGYITGTQAARACDEAGKRLCTDTEWLRACRGVDDSVYPYGATRIDGACNDARPVHPAVERFGTSEDWIWSRLGDACINQLPDSLAPTGAHPDCVTPDGVFDLMGNLHEWTADPAGTFRGGFYVDTVRNGEGCLYRTTAHDVNHWDYSTGFRCCADPL